MFRAGALYVWLTLRIALALYSPDESRRPACLTSFYKGIRLKLLILTDDDKLYSESHKARFSAMLEKRRKLSDAGRKGNEVRWSTKKEAVTTSSQCDKGAIANSSQSVATPSDTIAQNRIVEYSIVSDSIVSDSKVNKNNIEKEKSLKRKSSVFVVPDDKLGPIERIEADGRLTYCV